MQFKNILFCLKGKTLLWTKVFRIYCDCETIF